MRPFTAGFCINLLPMAGALDNRRKRIDVVTPLPAHQPQGTACSFDCPIFGVPNHHEVENSGQNIDKQRNDHVVFVIPSKLSVLGLDRS